MSDAYERFKKTADVAADEAQSIEFMVDLRKLHLMSPKVSETPRGNKGIVVYLAAVRKKYELRGLAAAQGLANRWNPPPERESKIDTSVD